MILKPIHDYKIQRSKLTVETQQYIDNLIFSMKPVMDILCDLQVKDIIEFIVPVNGKKIRLCFDPTKISTLYVMIQ